MFRDFLRSALFERFLACFGAAVGASTAVLAAWVLALRDGPNALPASALLAFGLGAAVAGGLGVPRLVAAGGRSRLARRAARGLFAGGFVLLVLAAGVVSFTAAFGGLALLLASTGLPPASGATLFEVGSAIGVGVLAAALAWGFTVGGRWLELTRHRVELRSLPAALSGLRIAHLSDLHIGNGLEGARLDALVDRVHAAGPDLVVLTGDLFDHDPGVLAAGARALGRLRARRGVYAVLGNHDLSMGAEAVAAALAVHAPGIVLLRAGWQRAPGPEPLHVAGLDDPGRDWTAGGCGLPALERLAAARPSEGPAILLVHRPDAFPQAAALGFDLVLAGHFHGGQVALPTAGSRWNPARALTPFHRGLYRRDDSVLYVSRGLGFAGPRIRLASRPEIAVLELA